MTKKTLVVNVTQEDINKGKKCNAVGCPVYRALQRALEPSGGHAHTVGGVRLAWVHDGQFWKTETPDKVSEWIRNFDGKPKRLSKPFRFRLHLSKVLEEN